MCPSIYIPRARARARVCGKETIYIISLGLSFAFSVRNEREECEWIKGSQVEEADSGSHSQLDDPPESSASSRRLGDSSPA